MDHNTNTMWSHVTLINNWRTEQSCDIRENSAQSPPSNMSTCQRVNPDAPLQSHLLNNTTTVSQSQIFVPTWQQHSMNALWCAFKLRLTVILLTNPKSHNTVPQGNPAYVNSPCPLRKQARWLACQIIRERWLRKINKHYYWNKKDDCKVEVTQFPHGLCKQIRVRVGLRKLDKRCRLSYFDTQSET